MAEKEYVIPDLPVDKDFHLFVSYHNSDAAKVHTLVELLERKGVKCCYYDRDFTAGCTLLENIRETMSKSVHMLVILSVEFGQSAYARYELTDALHLKINDGYSIIPIMVEPCTAPDNLKYVRYIDARDIDVTEMPSLIIDALVKNKIKADSKRTTGTQMSIGLTKYTDFPRHLSLSRYKLVFNETVRLGMRYRQVELTNDELAEIEEIVSSSNLVQYWHIFSHFVLAASLVLFLVLMLYICLYMTVIITSVGFTPEDSKGTLIALHVIISVLILKLFVIYCICWYIDSNESITSKWSKRAAQYKFWMELVTALSRCNKDAREKGRIVMFDYTNGELIVMRYDFRICQAYFMKRCDQREGLKVLKQNGESLKDYTNRLFDKFVKTRLCLCLTEPSITTRHTLSNGAKCVCLLVEEVLCSSVC